MTKIKRIKFKRPTEDKPAPLKNDCLHCEILRQIVAIVETDKDKFINEFIPMVAQALGELIASAPAEDRGTLLAKAITMMMECCGATLPEEEMMPTGGIEPPTRLN